MQRLNMFPSEEMGESGSVLDMKVLHHDAIFDMTMLGAAAGEMCVPRIAPPERTTVRVRIRVRDLMIATERLESVQRTQPFPGRINKIG